MVHIHAELHGVLVVLGIQLMMVPLRDLLVTGGADGTDGMAKAVICDETLLGDLCGVRFCPLVFMVSIRRVSNRSCYSNIGILRGNDCI